jgi:hypothetical protein
VPLVATVTVTPAEMAAFMEWDPHALGDRRTSTIRRNAPLGTFDANAHCRAPGGRVTSPDDAAHVIPFASPGANLQEYEAAVQERAREEWEVVMPILDVYWAKDCTKANQCQFTATFRRSNILCGTRMIARYYDCIIPSMLSVHV